MLNKLGPKCFKKIHYFRLYRSKFLLFSLISNLQHRKIYRLIPITIYRPIPMYRRIPIIYQPYNICKYILLYFYHLSIVSIKLRGTSHPLTKNGLRSRPDALYLKMNIPRVLLTIFQYTHPSEQSPKVQTRLLDLSKNMGLLQV